MDCHKYNTFDVKKCCEDKLSINFKTGKEYNGWFISGGIKIKRITIPKGRKNIPPKTYKSFAKQLNVSIEFFDGFMDCSNKLNEYLKELGLRSM